MCWCVSMSVYVCEWCTLSHYAVLARTSPKFFSPVVLSDYKVDHPTFHIVYRNSNPGLPHGHQTLVVMRFPASPTLIAEWGTASVARLAAPLGK